LFGKPPGLRQPAEAFPLKGDLIVDLGIITFICGNKPPLGGLGVKKLSKYANPD